MSNIFFLYAFFLWTGKSWKAPLSTSTRHYFWMGRTVTSRSAPWGRSGTCIKFTCVRLVQLFSSPNNRVLKTLVLLWLKCIFPLILQSGYFSSMFSGSWKESNMMVIELESPDQNIDTEGENSKNMFLTSPWYNKQVKDVVFILLTPNFHILTMFSSPSAALQVVFGSLYRDDVLIKPSRVVNILAAACMLQLVSMSSVKNNIITIWFLKNIQLLYNATIAFSFSLLRQQYVLPFHDHVHGFLWIANQKMFVNSSCQLVSYIKWSNWLEIARITFGSHSCWLGWVQHYKSVYFAFIACWLW